MGDTTEVGKIDGGAPSGPAGGDLSGAYPDPTVNTANVDHDSLLNYVLAQHRIINDVGSSTTELFSASKILALVSAVADGIDVKDPVDTSTEGLGNITLSGEQTLNGVLTSVSRIAVLEQTLGEDNGFYLTGSGAWVRTDDADTDAKVTNGMYTIVDNSASSVFKHRYVLTTGDPITVGVTPLTFAFIPDIEFGTTSGTATEGNDSRVPTQDENDALIGTDGTPSSANKYVTNSDSRLGGIVLSFDSASEGQSSNSTTSFNEKLKLTFTPEAGDYLINWYYEYSRSVSASSVEAKIELDDTTELGFTTHNIPTSNEFVGQSGFKKITLTNVSHDIDIDFRKPSGAANALIRKARLTVIKV